MAVDLTKLIDFDLLQRYDTKLKAWTEKKIVDSHEIIFTTKNSLPATGSMNLLYITEDSILLWDGSEYIKIGGQGTGTTFIPSIDANGDLTWTNNGGLANPDPVNVRGPAGKDGLDGKSAYDIAVKNGFEGTEAKWLESLKGQDGTNGASFTIKGLYPTYDDLIYAHPMGEAGDAYAVGDSDYNEIYNWSVDNLAWENLGSLEGPQGPKGEDSTVPGPEGKSAYQIALDNGFEGTEKEWLDSLSATGIQIKIVNELPETGEEKILYFLPIDNDTHEEYMWIAGKWEMIGTTKVDLSDYYTKSQVDEKIAEIELTPGEKGDDGPSIVSMRLDKNLHLISTLSNGVEIDAGKIDIDGLTVEKTEVIDVKLMTQEITFDGETTEFDLPTDSKTLMIYVNGLCLEENQDYTINEGTIAFNEIFNETDKGILRWFDKNSADSSETLWVTEDDIDSMFG